MRWVGQLGATLFVFTCCFGCGDSERECTPGPSAPEMAIRDLEQAPDSLIVAGQRYSLAIVAYRNGMPILGPPHPRPLNIVVRIVATGAGLFPNSVRPMYVWAINMQDVWGTSLRDGSRTDLPTNEREFSASCGPEWTPGINVDVVLQVAGAEPRLVITRGVPVRVAE